MSAKQLTRRWLQAENNVGEVRARGTDAQYSTLESRSKMMNPIAIQDEYVNRVSKLDPNGRNYVVNVSKAWKAAKKALLDYGLSESMTEQMMHDAHDMAQLSRFVGSL